MFQPSFRNRRLISLAITALALAIVWAIAWLQHSRLAHASFFTGSTVLGSLFLLMLLGLRRRLPMWPLGSVSTWTQIHIYSGIFAFGAYLIHVPAVIAGGPFEFALSLFFLIVSGSGFYGVYASRTLPKRLSAVDGQHRFDQVAWHRNQIAETAECLLSELSEPSSSEVLNSFYDKYLKPFFGARPSLAYVLVPSGHRRRRLLSNLNELDRYLESEGRKTRGRFAALVRRRDDLDYQFALQLRLRVWLVVHGVLSVILIGGSIIHAALAWRFCY